MIGVRQDGRLPQREDVVQELESLVGGCSGGWGGEPEEDSRRHGVKIQTVVHHPKTIIWNHYTQAQRKASQTQQSSQNHIEILVERFVWASPMPSSWGLPTYIQEVLVGRSQFKGLKENMNSIWFVLLHASQFSQWTVFAGLCGHASIWFDWFLSCNVIAVFSVLVFTVDLIYLTFPVTHSLFLLYLWPLPYSCCTCAPFPILRVYV